MIFNKLGLEINIIIFIWLLRWVSMIISEIKNKEKKIMKWIMFLWTFVFFEPFFQFNIFDLNKKSSWIYVQMKSYSNGKVSFSIFYFFLLYFFRFVFIKVLWFISYLFLRESDQKIIKYTGLHCVFYSMSLVSNGIYPNIHLINKW